MIKANLLISDSNRLFREGLRRILASRKIEVGADVATLNEALEVLRSGDGEVNAILCDPSANSHDEFIAMREIRQEFPDIKIVILTERINAAWHDLAVDRGASGFLPKEISADALVFSLELVFLGEQIFPTLHSMLEPKRDAASVQILTPQLISSRQISLSARENQILACLVKGMPNKTIARNLNMAEATVKVHLKALLRKINVQNRTQAAIWGMKYESQATLTKPPGPDFAEANGSALLHS